MGLLSGFKAVLTVKFGENKTNGSNKDSENSGVVCTSFVSRSEFEDEIVRPTHVEPARRFDDVRVKRRELPKIQLPGTSLVNPKGQQSKSLNDLDKIKGNGAVEVLETEKTEKNNVKVKEETRKASNEERLKEERRKKEEKKETDRKLKEEKLKDERKKANEEKLKQEKRREDEKKTNEKKVKEEKLQVGKLKEQKRKANEEKLKEEKRKANERKAREEKLKEEKLKVDKLKEEKRRANEEKAREEKLKVDKLKDEEKRKAKLKQEPKQKESELKMVKKNDAKITEEQEQPAAAIFEFVQGKSNETVEETPQNQQHKLKPKECRRVRIDEEPKIIPVDASSSDKTIILADSSQKIPQEEDSELFQESPPDYNDIKQNSQDDGNFKINIVTPSSSYKPGDFDGNFQIHFVDHSKHAEEEFDDDEISIQDEIVPVELFPSSASSSNYTSQAASIFFGEDDAPPVPKPRTNVVFNSNEEFNDDSDASC